MPHSDLRSQYEAAVANLATAVARQLASGATLEETARWAVAQRDAIKRIYRQQTPPAVLAFIESKTMRRYGNAMGPSVDDLRAAGKSWQQIIDSATRAGEHDFDDMA